MERLRTIIGHYGQHIGHGQQLAIARHRAEDARRAALPAPKPTRQTKRRDLMKASKRGWRTKWANRQ